MKNVIKLIVFVAFALAASSVSAQAKLGHIESQKLIQLMPEFVNAQKTLQMKQEEIQKEMDNLKEQFQTKLKEYSEKANTLSDVIRASKEQELQELQNRIQRFQENALSDLEKQGSDLMTPVKDKAMKAIQDVAKENGFAYIFDMSAGNILYAAETTQDILPLVKAKLGLK